MSDAVFVAVWLLVLVVAAAIIYRNYKNLKEVDGYADSDEEPPKPKEPKRPWRDRLPAWLRPSNLAGRLPTDLRPYLILLACAGRRFANL